MNEQSKKLLASRFEWVSYQLEREAYSQQIKGRKTGLKHFDPCVKALVFTAAMYTDDPDILVIQRAALENCQCHRKMGEKELTDLYDKAVELYPTPTLLAG